MTKDPEPIGKVIRRLMRGKLARKARRESAIWEGWEDVVGTERAARLLPLRLRSGVLWVGVESPALLYEVSQFERESLLARLRERFPDLEIEDVRFRLA